MLSIEERKKLKSLLPISKKYGFNQIKKKLPHLTKNQISQAFLYDNRYKPEVMDAAIAVIEEHKNQDQSRKNLIAEL